MKHRYTSLGAAPALAKRSVEKRDAILARTGPAARQLLKASGRSPAKLGKLLGRIDPNLPGRVHQVARHLNRQGMAADTAVERAVALSLADSMIEQVKALGERVRRGMPPAPLFSTAMGLGGLGDEAADVVGSMAQGILCSDGLRTTLADMVGRQEGRDAADATLIGFSVAQGAAQCGRTPTPTPTPPADDPEPESSSLVIPIVVGVGVLALVGGIVWVTRKK